MRPFAFHNERGIYYAALRPVGARLRKIPCHE